MHPHTIEPLSHILSFSLPTSVSPCAMVITRDRLAVASNNPQMASYSLDMFDLTERGESLYTMLTTPSTHTHLPPPPLTHKHTVSYTSQVESSHRDSITCLDACPKLRLFASSSLDSTVRVWSDDNHPVRVLCLDYPPTGLAFCSTQAHIMIAIHSHLHIINNTECE